MVDELVLQLIHFWHWNSNIWSIAYTYITSLKIREIKDLDKIKNCTKLKIGQKWKENIFEKVLLGLQCLVRKQSCFGAGFFLTQGTLFGTHRKGLIQHCERSELRLYYEWTKVHKKCQNSQFGEFLETWSLRSNSVTRQVTFKKRPKIGGKCQHLKIQMRHFGDF